jgi:protein-tyrosine phosphatase
MIKVLMVCLGNICRSPLAEGILQNKVDSNFVFVDSAGTAGYHIGKKPDKRSIAVANKYGIEISKQNCRKFDVRDFIDFDIIYVMDKSNYDTISTLASNESEVGKVKLLLDEVDLDITEVPDPYYGGEDGFEYVFNLIDNACNTIAKNLTKK